MSKAPFDFSVNFQDQMLSLMLKDLVFAKNVVKYIPLERLHSDAHKFLFQIIDDKLKENSIITFIEIEDRLKKIEKHKRRMLKNFCKKIFNTVVESSDYMKTVLTDYAKKNYFIDIFQSGQTFWNAKQYDNAYEYTMGGISELFSINFEDDAVISIEEFEERRRTYIAESSRSAKHIPTNIPELDKILKGGLEKGRMGVILADAKKGKSIALNHFACAAIMTRTARVAMFILEGTTEEAIFRVLSRLSGIEYNRIEKDEVTEEEQEILDKIKKKYCNMLDLIPMNKHWNNTPENIEVKIRELETAGRKPDLVVVDYGDLLTTTEKLEKRHEQTAVFRALKSIALSHKVALWTASQAQNLKTEPEKEFLMRAKDISESYEKVRICDLIATLNQTPREKKFGIMRLHLDIFRGNSAGKTFSLITNYEKMIFSNRKYGVADFKKDQSFDWMLKRRKGRR